MRACVGCGRYVPWVHSFWLRGNTVPLQLSVSPYELPHFAFNLVLPASLGFPFFGHVIGVGPFEK